MLLIGFLRAHLLDANGTFQVFWYGATIFGLSSNMVFTVGVCYYSVGEESLFPVSSISSRRSIIIFTQEEKDTIILLILELTVTTVLLLD